MEHFAYIYISLAFHGPKSDLTILTLSKLQTQRITFTRKLLNGSYVYCSQRTPVMASLESGCHHGWAKSCCDLTDPRPHLHTKPWRRRHTPTQRFPNRPHTCWPGARGSGALAPGTKAARANALQVNSSNICKRNRQWLFGSDKTFVVLT